MIDNFGLDFATLDPEACDMPFGFGSGGGVIFGVTGGVTAVSYTHLNPCPPMVVGVGIGGTFDKCALLAKKALMRPLDTQNPDPFYADLEKEMLEDVYKRQAQTLLQMLQHG